ncbi:surface carbohydrate biosynthesis protein [Roseibium sp. MMSF_3412]|uniref:surface carbohydrate biosynthesis protein n=1 Tax=Roseibium sp. MMSF_3412 TaxID=3046712 RepID=UPI002740295A|nr:surface carbohydrate biosynthesis protein [Roseibium sp. MMSF_3412]
MNIYMNLEVAVREMDSKLLLAVKAAERGHQVLIGEEKQIDRLRRRYRLAPGIYHTKSLTPSKQKIELHSALKAAGFLITSIDEEGGLIDASYERFARLRYSEEMLGLADAVFCWGPQDFNQLKSTYADHAHLMRMTGSPRVDLWRPEGKEYSTRPGDMPRKPYLLVSSNFGVLNNYRNFWDLIRFERNAGYFERDPNYEKRRYYMASETVVLMYEFVKAIEHLAQEFPDIDIVLRPHPIERPESWKAMLDPGFDNVKVTRSGSITPWVHDALAVMHNGCTTAMEATVSQVPVLTFKPVKQQYPREIPNSVGTSVQTRTELADALRKVLETSDNTPYKPHPKDVALVEERVCCRNGVFAADMMIDCWEELHKDVPSEPNDWNKVVLRQRFRSLKDNLKKWTGKKSKTSLGHKFPEMRKQDIVEKVEQIRAAGSITSPVGVTMLSGNMFLISKDG